MAAYISNEKVFILDVADDGPSIKLLGQLESRETSQCCKEKIQEFCFANQDLIRLPISQLTIGTVAVAQVNVKSSISFYRVQIIDNKNWNSGLVNVLLIDEFKWNYSIPFTNLFIAPSTVQEIKMCSEVFYLADVSPMCLNTWSDNCINVLKGQLINKAVNGTVFRERGKIALFRPYEPSDQGQLLAKTMVQCGMAYYTPSFPGLSPFANQSPSFLSNKFVENSFLYSPDQYVSTMIAPKSCAYPLVPVVPFSCLQQGNAVANRALHPSMNGNGEFRAPCNFPEKCDRFCKPVLQPGFQDMGRVTFIENGPWKFCLKLKCHQYYENNLERQIQRIVKSNLNSLNSFDNGMSVLCKTKEKYYRGLIIGTDDYTDGKVKIFLIDYGSEENICISNIWSVPQDLYEIPMLMCRCCLEGLPRSHIPQVSKNFKDLVTNQTLNVTINNETSDLLTNVEIIIGNYSLIDVITFEIYKKETLNSGDEVSICYVNEKNGFIFLQLAKNLERIDNLQHEIHNENKSANIMTKAYKGFPCLAIFSEDLNWYRCVVVDSLYGAVRVKYVDYGNEEEHTKPQNIKEIKDSLLNILPSQAIPCILEGLEDKLLNFKEIMKRVDGQTFIVTVVEEVKSFMNGIPIKLPKVKLLDTRKQRFVNEDLMLLTETKSHVKAKISAVHFAEEVSVYPPASDPNSVAQSYNKEKVLNEVPIVPDWLKVCKVTHVESPSLFYVNLIQNETIYRIINESLKDSFNNNKLCMTFDNGEYVMIADFKSQDPRYYRAVVLKRGRDSYNLKLVDIGREQTVSISQVKPLPPEVSLERYPPQAVKCGMESSSQNNGTEDFVKYVTKQPVNIHFIRKERDTWKVAILKTSDMMADVNRGNYFDSRSKTYKYCSDEPNRPNWREKDSKDDALSWRSPNKGSYDRSPRNSTRNVDDVWRPWNRNSNTPQKAKSPDVDVNREATEQFRAPVSSACKNLNKIGWDDESSVSCPEDKLEKKFPEQPSLSSTETVFVTYVNKDSKLVSVQRKSDTDVLSKLNADIEVETASETGKQISYLISIGDLCLAQSNEDDLWYRGRVLAIDGENIEVHYVDFGNVETLKQTRLRDIPVHLCELHELCYLCTLQDEDRSMVLNADDEEMIANVISKEGSKYLVSFQQSPNAIDASAEESGFDVEETLHSVKEEILNSSDVEKFDKLEQIQNGTNDNLDVCDHIESPKIDEVVTPLGTVLSLFISYIEEDGTLWVQLGSNASLIDELMNSLSSLVENESNLDTIDVGEFCCGKYSVDEGWYRAKIISIENEKKDCKVSFIDYGNAEIISFNDLKRLPKECVALPAQGIHCSLFSVEHKCLLKGSEIRCNLENFNEMQIEGIFETSDNLELILKNATIDGEMLESKILSEVSLAISKASEVEFYKNIECDAFASIETDHELEVESQHLSFHANDDYPNKISSTVSETEEVNDSKSLNLLVAFVEADGSVWVQDLSQAQQLDSLMEEIQLHVESKEASHYDVFQVDDICICVYSEDEGYYRAKVVKVTENFLSVHYVDYGNAGEVPVSNVYSMVDKFASLPFQAIKCTLDALNDCEHETKVCIANELITKSSLKGKMKNTENEIILIDVYVDDESLISFKSSFEKSKVEKVDGTVVIKSTNLSDDLSFSENQFEGDVSKSEEEFNDQNNKRSIYEEEMEKFAQPIATEILESVNEVVSSMALINTAESFSETTPKPDDVSIQCTVDNSDLMNISGTDFSLEMDEQEAANIDSDILQITANDDTYADHEFKKANYIEEECDTKSTETKLLTDFKIKEGSFSNNSENSNVSDNEVVEESDEKLMSNNTESVENCSEFDRENFESINFSLTEKENDNSEVVIKESDVSKYDHENINATLKEVSKSKDFLPNVIDSVPNFTDADAIPDTKIRDYVNSNFTERTTLNFSKEDESLDQEIEKTGNDLMFNAVDDDKDIVVVYSKVADEIKFLSANNHNEYEKTEEVNQCTDKNSMGLPVKLEVSESSSIESLNQISSQFNKKLNEMINDNVEKIKSTINNKDSNENVALLSRSYSSDENLMHTMSRSDDEYLNTSLLKVNKCTDETDIELPIKLEISESSSVESVNQISLQINQKLDVMINDDEEKIKYAINNKGSNEDVAFLTRSYFSDENLIQTMARSDDEYLNTPLLNKEINSTIESEEKNLFSSDILDYNNEEFKDDNMPNTEEFKDDNMPNTEEQEISFGANVSEEEKGTSLVNSEFAFQGNDLETFSEHSTNNVENENNISNIYIVEEADTSFSSNDEFEEDTLDTGNLMHKSENLCRPGDDSTEEKEVLQEEAFNLNLVTTKSEENDLIDVGDVDNYNEEDTLPIYDNDSLKNYTPDFEEKLANKIKEKNSPNTLVDFSDDEENNPLHLNYVLEFSNDEENNPLHLINETGLESFMSEDIEKNSPNTLVDFSNDEENNSLHLNNETGLESFMSEDIEKNSPNTLVDFSNDEENNPLHLNEAGLESFMSEDIENIDFNIDSIVKCKPGRLKEELSLTFDDNEFLCKKFGDLTLPDTDTSDCESAAKVFGENNDFSEYLKFAEGNDDTHKKNKPMCMAYANTDNDNSSISIVQFKETKGLGSRRNSYYIEDVYEIITYDTEQDIQTESPEANSLIVSEDAQESKLSDCKFFEIISDSHPVDEYESGIEINEPETLPAGLSNNNSSTLCEDVSSLMTGEDEITNYSAQATTMANVKNEFEGEMEIKDSSSLMIPVIDPSVIKSEQLLSHENACFSISEINKELTCSESFENYVQDISKISSKELDSFEEQVFENSKEEFEVNLDEEMRNNQNGSDLEEIISIGKIVYIDSSPLCIWLQRDEDFADIMKIELEMKQTISNGLEVPNNIANGHLYASYFCGNLLRTKVTAIRESSLKIVYVDTGKKCCVNLDNLYACPKSLLTIPPMAYPYQLPVHIQEENVPKAITDLYDRCFNQICAYNDVTSFLRSSVKSQGRHAIISSSNVGSLTDYLVAKGLALNYSNTEIFHNELINELNKSTQLVLEEIKKL